MHAENAPNEPSPGRAGLMRGVLVILTAVAIGAFVLSRGGGTEAPVEVATSDEAGQETTDGDDPLAGDPVGSAIDPAPATEPETGGALTATTGTTMPDSAEDTGDAMVDDGTSPETTGSTEPAGPDIAGPAQINVLVLNAEGTKGIAGEGSDLLRAEGYLVLPPRNATVLSATSTVLYTAGFEAEAAAVAGVFGQGPGIVAPLDVNAPPIGDIGEAMVIVVIGQDEALGL
ncbi:MAG: LytR C-terminal domain-containing protein [Actinomycetota bacterium]